MGIKVLGRRSPRTDREDQRELRLRKLHNLSEEYDVSAESSWKIGLSLDYIGVAVCVVETDGLSNFPSLLVPYHEGI